jgi:hypothetical protein
MMHLININHTHHPQPLTQIRLTILKSAIGLERSSDDAASRRIHVTDVANVGHVNTRKLAEEVGAYSKIMYFTRSLLYFARSRSLQEPHRSVASPLVGNTAR